jgi:diketogulonate reductase-like aldo/keto reductase
VYFTLGAGSKEVVARCYNFFFPEKMSLIRSSVEDIAKKHNKTMAQVSLAWLLTKDGA